MKSIIVLTCYILSAAGMFFMWIGTMSLQRLGGVMFVVLFLWLAAFVAHYRMSMAWVDGRRLGKTFSFASVAFGLLGFLAVPIAATLFNGESFVRGAAVIVPFELLLMSPATVLAVYLNRYHASTPDYVSQSKPRSSSA